MDRLGDRAHALELVREEVELARGFGGPRALGIALRAWGLVERGSRGLELLHEAAAVLEPSPAVLDRARVLVDLGAAIRRTGRRAEARAQIRPGLDLAQRSGATALAELAREELLSAGGRPRRRELSGREALTPSERRVARMAAKGMTNREIAEALFVTQKAVSYHLGNVYRKVDVSRREELARLFVEEPVTANSGGGA